jgi:hypothetical protein
MCLRSNFLGIENHCANLVSKFYRDVIIEVVVPGGAAQIPNTNIDRPTEAGNFVFRIFET